MTILRNRFGRHATCALLAVAAALASTTSFAMPRYDGLWSVSIITDKGSCDRGYRYPIRISNGMLENAGSIGFAISGKVAPTGAIKVTLSHGNASATGSGRLAGNAGQGLWSGGDCSGTWSAERRSS